MIFYNYQCNMRTDSTESPNTWWVWKYF